MFTRRRLLSFCLASLAIGTILLSFDRSHLALDQPGNLYLHQANALIHGKMDVSPDLFDVAVMGDKGYLPYPPAPAVLLVPFVVLFGPRADLPMLLALLLALGTVGMAIGLFKQLGIPWDMRWVLAGAFLMGTPYWFVFINSNGVWHLAHVAAVFFLFAAIRESFGRGRGWLVGLMVAGAFLSRQLTLLALVAIAAIIVRNAAVNRRRGVLGELVSVGVVLLVGLGVYCWFNWARFGNPLDTGYGHIPLGGLFGRRVTEHGLLSPAYVPFNLLYLLIQGFHVEFQSTLMLSHPQMNPFGTSLLAASPFILVGLYSRREVWTRTAIWLSVVGMAVGHLLYYNNGNYQVNGQRFALDYLPLLIVLVGDGLSARREKGEDRLWIGVVVYSIFLNWLALLIIPNYGPLVSLGKTLFRAIGW